jgi:hypothetical protein
VKIEKRLLPQNGGLACTYKGVFDAAEEVMEGQRIEQTKYTIKPGTCKELGIPLPVTFQGGLSGSQPLHSITDADDSNSNVPDCAVMNSL